MRATRPYGPVAFLLECDGPHEAVALHLTLRADPLPGVVQTVPGAASLLVECATPEVKRDAARTLASFPVDVTLPPGREYVLDVRYDGADLDAVARSCGLSTEEVVDRHVASSCTVALIGFTPGFAYLSGLDPALATPRRTEPRTAVPAGSVAIGGEWTGVYPRRGPGGWNLIGTAGAALWDLALPVPAVLQLGDVVRFRAV